MLNNSFKSIQVPNTQQSIITQYILICKIMKKKPKFLNLHGDEIEILTQQLSSNNLRFREMNQRKL